MSLKESVPDMIGLYRYPPLLRIFSYTYVRPRKSTNCQAAEQRSRLLYFIHMFGA